jgi:ATP-dependent DNA ligase
VAGGTALAGGWVAAPVLATTVGPIVGRLGPGSAAPESGCDDPRGCDIIGARVTSRVYPPTQPLRSCPPAIGDDWLHEPKWDGFSFQVIKDGAGVRFYSRHGTEYTDRLPGMVEAFGKLPTRSAILDGELCLIDPRGSAHFYRLMAQMRTSHPDETQLMFLAFDLLHQDGVDLRGLPLSERKRDLDRLCRKSKIPYLTQVETFPDGAILFGYCNKFGFEGVVSKRLSSRYMSGPSRHWFKVKCPDWKRVNAERGKLFEDRASPSFRTPNSHSPGNGWSLPGSSSACDHHR